ncbi:hypothetical protein BJ508DRAFT_308952 [Ascobolus immersus RN42]|uniref:Uncharacterized protein n=1 Tax=Ascobolus immersus RN42 TaxID=1160509 RepID=A0A3N4I3V9_ASCIM|nr:hypothetical protein BJ508DRAFT_308952 [Ascobolus immersus RN42]
MNKDTQRIAKWSSNTGTDSQIEEVNYSGSTRYSNLGIHYYTELSSIESLLPEDFTPILDPNFDSDYCYGTFKENFKKESLSSIRAGAMLESAFANLRRKEASFQFARRRKQDERRYAELIQRTEKQLEQIKLARDLVVRNQPTGLPMLPSYPSDWQSRGDKRLEDFSPKFDPWISTESIIDQLHRFERVRHGIRIQGHRICLGTFLNRTNYSARESSTPFGTLSILGTHATCQSFFNETLRSRIFISVEHSVAHARHCIGARPWDCETKGEGRDIEGLICRLGFA